MLVSCKVSNTILSFLDSAGGDLASFYGRVKYPKEFLRDPSAWLEAEEMEQFLGLIDSEFDVMGFSSIAQEAGKNISILKSWGVLDSVLRILSRPEDLFEQPETFLSYFFSPAPPVAKLQSTVDSIKFDLPIHSGQYPNLSLFFINAMEALPTYLNQENFDVSWTEFTVSVSWKKKQRSLLGDSDRKNRVFKPELINSVLKNIEVSQKKLKKLNQEYLEKEAELQLLKQQFSQYDPDKINIELEVKKGVGKVINHIHRLNDYFLRAKQAVTILSSQSSHAVEPKDLIKRMGWETVTEKHAQLTDLLLSDLRKLKNKFDGTKEKTNIYIKKDKNLSDVNEVVESVFAEVSGKFSKGIRVEKHFFLQEKVSVDQNKFKLVIDEILKCSLSDLDGQGEIRVVTRPKGKKAEIEISDTGRGKTQDEIESLFNIQALPGGDNQSIMGLGLARSIVKSHKGSFELSSVPKSGSTYTIEIPLV